MRGREGFLAAGQSFEQKRRFRYCFRVTGTLRHKFAISSELQILSALAHSTVKSVHSEIRFQGVFYVAGTIGEHCELSVFNCLADARKKVILAASQEIGSKLLILNGGQRRDRTADAGLFRAA
jgi:hypothetical protein